MASRALRSRTVEPSQEDLETPAGERPSESEGLGSLESSERLGSSDQQTSEIPEPPLSELEQTQEKVSQPRIQQPSISEASDLKNMLAGMFAIMQETVRADLVTNNESIRTDIATNNEKLQERVKGDLAANQESVRADISSIKADLAANNERVRADLAASQENVRIELSKIRKDLKAENESLDRKF